MSKIISVANQKGGVGKTTTSINLSASLARFNKKILLIDIDPQGNATSGIGLDKNNLDNNVYDLLINDNEPSSVIKATEYENLHIIPSNSDLTGAEVELTPLIARESRLKRQLTPVKDIYDFIIIDCPPSLGLLTINSLTASDSVLIPLQCEYYALEGLSQLLTTIDLIRNNLNPNLRIEGILLTMCDFRTNLSSQVIDDVRAHFGNQVYESLIPRSVKLSEAPSFGKPIIYYNEKSRGSQAYVNFAKELLIRNGNKIPEIAVFGPEIDVPHGNIDSDKTPVPISIIDTIDTNQNICSTNSQEGTS